MKFPADPRRIAKGLRHGMELTMRVKSIALWMLALLLAVALFYLFRDEMARQGAKEVGLRPMLSGLPAVS